MSVDNTGEPVVTDKLIVHRRDLPQQTVYSWARDGKMLSAWSADRNVVPVDGTEIHLRIIAFPGGSIREIHLNTSARTHPHDSYEDVLFYQIDGRRVQMCKEHSHEVNPGDVTLEPAGIEHSTYQLIGGLFLEFAFPAPLQPEAEATWINRDQVQAIEVAEWMQDGRTVRGFGDFTVTAPAGAAFYSVRKFDLPRYPLFETTVARGTKLLPRKDLIDQLYYVVSGKLNAMVSDARGEIRDEVMSGDSIRTVGEHSYQFTALEDSVLVHTAIPSSAL